MEREVENLLLFEETGMIEWLGGTMGIDVYESDMRVGTK
jgi:hypothetical protein